MYTAPPIINKPDRSSQTSVLLGEDLLLYTDPHKFLYSELTNLPYIMDDFGNAVKINARAWYAPFYWET